VTAESVPAPTEVEKTLERGEITLQGQFIPGSNFTFLVTVSQEGCEVPAVYKPMRGEQPLWDFPPASLARREVAAYLVNQALGWGLVPFTVLREGPFGPGSLQRYIDYNPRRHYFSFNPTERQRLRPVALFDLLINNADRKGSHVFFEKRTRRLYAIDHGLCFHAEPKLRTVIWDFAGEPFPADLLRGLAALQEHLPALEASLRTCLDGQECAAMAQRLSDLLAEPVYPHPPEDRRAYPYPPL
jgi:uncharacterized repeat protein (TIGR03843 family)